MFRSLPRRPGTPALVPAIVLLLAAPARAGWETAQALSLTLAAPVPVHLGIHKFRMDQGLQVGIDPSMQDRDGVLRVLAIAPDGKADPKGFNRVRDEADKLAAALRARKR